MLEFVRALAHPVGEPVENILRHAREINFPRPDLEEMERIINEQFEQIDWDDWNNITAFSA